MMLYSTDLLLDKNKPEQIKQPKLPCIFLWIRGWIPCFNLKLSEFDFWRASRIVDCVCWFIIWSKIWVCFFLSIVKHFFISFSHSYQKKNQSPLYPCSCLFCSLLFFDHNKCFMYFQHFLVFWNICYKLPKNIATKWNESGMK